jgi:hypothetical protein
MSRKSFTFWQRTSQKLLKSFMHFTCWTLLFCLTLTSCASSSLFESLSTAFKGNTRFNRFVELSHEEKADFTHQKLYRKLKAKDEDKLILETENLREKNQNAYPMNLLINQTESKRLSSTQKNKNAQPVNFGKALRQIISPKKEKKTFWQKVIHPIEELRITKS